MVDGYVMRARRRSDPTQTVYWAVINAPDFSALLSEYDSTDLTLPAEVDYVFETAVDGLAGSPSGFAGGDLAGQYPNPKVIKINGRPVSDISPDDGYVLTWKNLRWEPKPQNAPEFLTANRVLISNQYGKISADTPLTGQKFSVFMENPANLMSFQKLTEDMVDPGFSVEIIDLNYVVSEQVINPTVTAGIVSPGSQPKNINYSRATVSSSISDDAGNPVSLQDGYGAIITGIDGLSQFKIVGTFVGSPNLEDSKIFKLVASDGVKTIQKQLKINWLFNFYYGVGPDWSSFLSNQDKVNFIKNTVTMTPVLTNKKTRSVSVICGDDQYVYYAYPSSYGDVSFYYNGVSGGFDKIDTIYVGNVYDPSGALQPYCVWRSVNPDLGNLSVNIE